MLLLGDPSIDIRISFFLVAVSLVISLIVLIFAKRKLLSVVVFSILGNLAFLLNIGSEMFDSYNIKWFGYFSLLIWPIVNIFLIIYYAKTSPKKK
jgi:hypothetical protein